MHEILFATGNKTKFSVGQQICHKFGISLKQATLEIDEIQSEDIAYIIRDKARRAFALLNRPVVVSDDSWHISGLGGFPGPYMKSMNHWLSEDDFLRLCSHLDDRSVFLQQQIAYTDERESVLFRQDIPAQLLRKARGHSSVPFQNIVTMDGDDGLSVGEIIEHNAQQSDQRLDNYAKTWQQFADWYQAKQRQ